MSKVRQSFTREKIEYKLNERTDTLEELPERTNLQELINSHYDETLYYNLERYFADNVNVLPADDTIADEIELEGSKADRMLNALERVQNLRSKYAIPDYYSDIEVLRYLRQKAAENAPAITTDTTTEGGETDGETQQTQTEPQS